MVCGGVRWIVRSMMMRSMLILLTVKDCVKWQGGAECRLVFVARRSLFAEDGVFEFWCDLEKHGLCEMVKGMPKLVDDNGIDLFRVGRIAAEQYM